MQKIWFGLFGIIITTGAIAADLCVRNDAMVVALNPLVGGTVAGSDSLNKTWSTRFSYGMVGGIATCDLGSQTECAAGQIAVNQNMNFKSTGAVCYCKMLQPTESKWVSSGYYIGSITDGRNYATCAANCASNCAKLVAGSMPLRSGLFSSVNHLD